MRKVIRTIAAVAMLFATTIGMANEPKLETDGVSKSIHFEWEAQIVRTSLKILDTNGSLVYSEYINEADTYARNYDLASLSEGAYLLKVENGMKEIVYSISVNKSNISILGMKEIVKPTFRKKESRVYLNFLNHEMEEVKVGVIDSLGNVLFEESFKEHFVVEKAFNFKGAFKGEYTIVFEDGENTYYEMVTVK